MKTHHDETAGRGLSLTWELEICSLTIARFAQLVVERGFEHTAAASWATERMTLEGVLDLALSSERGQSARSAVLDLGDELGAECLVHLWIGRGHVSLRVAARSLDDLATAKAWVQQRYQVSRPDERQEISVAFWAHGRYGESVTRRIAVPSWSQVADNYPPAVSALLAALVERRFDDEHSGRLILWHGPPGTGKTFALRALAWEWRKWCGIHYISDPETFLGADPKYMLDVLLDEAEDDDVPGWRLLVLEDTGELLAMDAKDRTGQGLSRLLNVVDGLIGQGLRILVLVTTNEMLRSLHPAVSRPGRCVAQVEFAPFTPEEADEWLERYGREGAGAPFTLASLYEQDGGSARPAPRPLGFAVR